MSDGLKVVPISNLINKNAVEVLEEALAMAKSGEISQCAMCWVMPDETISGRYSSGDRNITMWAALSHCEREFYKMTFFPEE